MIKKLALKHFPSVSRTVGSNSFDQRCREFKFETRADEQNFKDLIAELRCLVCQNQSLADSDAELAHDLLTRYPQHAYLVYQSHRTLLWNGEVDEKSGEPICSRRVPVPAKLCGQ